MRYAYFLPRQLVFAYGHELFNIAGLEDGIVSA
jgi:hypothetical protein